jgi:hypothetical protein
MIQRGRRHRFLFETPQSIFVGSEVDRENLQRNFAMQTSVFREIHLTHTASTEFRDYGVMRESGIGGKEHLRSLKPYTV